VQIVHSWPNRAISLLFISLWFLVLTPLFDASSTAIAYYAHISSSSRALAGPPPPSDIALDSRLPVQTVSKNSNFANLNAKFGSRFDFTVFPQYSVVRSGTDGVFHENDASYIVGVTPAGQHDTYIFHMGKPDPARGDRYVANEHWIEGLDTTRWVGDATHGLHLIVDIIDPFRGEPGCIAIADCAEAVKDDTVPIFIIGISLQNQSVHPLSGQFLFGSNRPLAPTQACLPHTTPDGHAVTIVSYSHSADVTGGTLFLVGDQAHWHCNTTLADRAGLAWPYQVGGLQTETVYLILGAWNNSQWLFFNTHLPAGCQNEGLYASQEWSSETDVADFAIDNLLARDNLLAQAQDMENYLIDNTTLSAPQRWLIGDTLRSYKASSWLVGRQSCAGGGYDAALYEGSYGFLSTVDVMHEYSYFEITRVPWFFKAAMSAVFTNATSDGFGLYFQHDQGGDVDSSGNCTDPDKGIPTIRATCYAPPRVNSGLPMPTEENDDVALLMAYYEFVTGDTAFLRQHITQIDAAMQHNISVGDPHTGIAYNFQDTTTTYDAASDCLHNAAPGAGNLYYQGLKEATGYRAAAYLDSLISGNTSGPGWTRAAAKIEAAMVQEYNHHGFIPIADSTAFSNCGGRTIALGEGLFYAHLIGADASMNQTLLHDLAVQYPDDLKADTLASPAMIAMTSTPATGYQCDSGHCHRYEWFSKVILSSLVADAVYAQYGCGTCAHLDVTEAAYIYNQDFDANFGDGFHDDSSPWEGNIYPRGIISWAFLSAAY
jgi:hypothetical protein